MAMHNDLGKEGEELAQAFLLRNDYSILHRNWRYGRCEIDIIALKNGQPHFIEVKLRSSEKFGWPEENAGRKKIKLLLQAANEFMLRHPQYKDFRINILSIITHGGNRPDFFLIRDVYL